MATATELTRVWAGDDGGAYCIRGLDDGSVAWAGLHAWAGGQDVGFHKGMAFTNVFWGRVSDDGKTLSGQWADVPRGETLNSGTLSLAIELDPYWGWKLRRIDAGTSGGFAAETLSYWPLPVPLPAYPQQIPLPPQDIESLADLIRRVDSSLAGNNPPCRDFTVMWGTIKNVKTPPWPNNSNIDPYDYNAFFNKFDINWDGDLDFDFKPDFGRQERDFWTRGWVGTRNEDILTQFDKYNQHFHCEIMMYARDNYPPSFTEVLPAWLAQGGNSVLVNGRPANGHIASGEGLTFHVGPVGEQIVALREGAYARVTGVVALDVGHTWHDDPPEIHPVYAIDVVQNFRRRPPVANINLTGAWGGGDMGTYYLRQIGNTLWWLGLSRDQGRTFANVFHGTVAGEVIKGDWIDVPMGEIPILGNGSLTLSGGSQSTELLKISQTGVFGALTWTKLYDTPLPPPVLDP